MSMNGWDIDIALVQSILESVPEPYVPNGHETILRALYLTSFDRTKAVIVGQDPYPNPSQANGLAFSVCANCNTPPSLRNIKKKIAMEFGVGDHNTIPNDLEYLAKQGVLLLNRVLTVQIGKPGSHSGYGWEQITDRIIRQVSQNKSGVFFFLWGKKAQEVLPLIDQNKHWVITAPHPSGFSAHKGFFDVEQFLKVPGIDWAGRKLP